MGRGTSRWGTGIGSSGEDASEAWWNVACPCTAAARMRSLVSSLGLACQTTLLLLLLLPPMLLLLLLLLVGGDGGRKAQVDGMTSSRTPLECAAAAALPPSSPV